MGNFDDIFSDNHKVALNHDGEIFKFNDWSVGCRFAGVYIGHHIWQSDDGPVVAHDFARCEIDGKKQEDNKVFTINEFAALKKIAENITPGQVVGLKYNGRSERKGNPHDITPYIDPNKRDENWRNYAGTPIDSFTKKDHVDNKLSPALDSSEEEPVATAEVFDTKKEEVPFKTAEELKKEIIAIVGTQHGLKEEAEIKVKIIEDAELPFNDNVDNLEAILAKLTEKYKA